MGDNPPPPGGAAQLPSARKKLVVPPPDAGANPCSEVVNGFSIAVTCVAVKSAALAVPPVLLPFIVLAPICERLEFVTTFALIVVAALPGPAAVIGPVRAVM